VSTSQRGRCEKKENTLSKGPRKNPETFEEKQGPTIGKRPHFSKRLKTKKGGNTPASLSEKKREDFLTLPCRKEEEKEKDHMRGVLSRSTIQWSTHL